MNDNEMAVAIFGMLMSGIVLSLLVWHFGRAWAERIRNPGRIDAVKALREELTGEFQQLHAEIAELAERVDFAERLLAKEREAARLAPPAGR
jgi:hypothetical protein